MRTPDLSRPSSAIVVGLALLLAGCATSSTTHAPALPQLPSPPSLPSPPQTRPGSASGTKAEAQGEKKGGEGEKAEAKAKGETGDKGDTAETQGSGPGATGRSGAGAAEGQTPDEHRDALDGQLQTSMAEFDGMLLKEQNALEEKQRKDPLPERGGETGGGAAGSEGSERGSSDQGTGKAGDGQAGSAGRGDDRTPAERRSEAEAAAKQGQAGGKGSTGAATADTGTGGSTDAGRLEGGTAVTAPVEGGPAGPGPDSPTLPPDVGDGKNDDVVARQLREAATQEKDPVIREKLWEEYRAYQKSAGKGGS